MLDGFVVGISATLYCLAVVEHGTSLDTSIISVVFVLRTLAYCGNCSM